MAYGVKSHKQFNLILMYNSYKEINDFESDVKKYTDTRLMSLIEKESETFQVYVEMIRAEIFQRTGDVTVSVHGQIADEIHLIVLKEVSRRWLILKECIE